jgi:hypothetical protein
VQLRRESFNDHQDDTIRSEAFLMEETTEASLLTSEDDIPELMNDHDQGHAYSQAHEHCPSMSTMVISPLGFSTGNRFNNWCSRALRGVSSLRL